MIGRRVYDVEPHKFEPGDYGWWVQGGHWVAETPNGHGANLSGHKVVEHDDKTITVSPSVAVGSSRWDATKGKMVPFEVYHGFLERGVWRTA